MASIGEKRPAAEEEGLPSRKKRLSDVARAAEIVLVLAAMGEIRGGAVPTDKEKEMMEEARGRVVKACEEFKPKDLFPEGVFGKVIKDAGLEKDEGVGFRSQKLSVFEKFLVAKHKWPQKSSAAAAESPGVLHATGTPESDRPNHPTTVLAGRVQPALPLSHSSTGNPPSFVYQSTSGEVKTPLHPSGVSTPLFRRDSSTAAVPRVDRPDFRPESKLNVPSYASPAKVHPSGNPMLQRSSHYPQQIGVPVSDKFRPDNKVPSHPSWKVEPPVGSALRVDPQASKPSLAQATSGYLATTAQRVQGTNTAQGHSHSNPHIEIGRIVQKALQPYIPRQPIWNVPSRDYMNKSVPCQVCKVAITKVENALVCDACEKGYHIKCVESHNQKGVSKGEWHCFKCLSLSNGKPLPPKYGRVTRSFTAPKVDSNTAAVQSSAEMKVEELGGKGNQSKVIPKGSNGLQRPTRSTSSKLANLETKSNTPNGKVTQGDDISSRRDSKDDEHNLENCQDNATRGSVSGSTPDSAVPSIERAQEEKLVSELKRQLSPNSSGTGSKLSDHVQLLNDVQEKSGLLHGNLNVVNQKDARGIVRNEPANLSGDSSVVSELSSLPGHVSDNVDWIGDVLQVVDEKIYYQSCCVDGVVYKVQDHAFMYSSSCDDKLTPSKLQAMWEDRKTRSKWVIGNKCYFHTDLPQTVGCPFSPESNEVYESNHGITVMAGLIRGPCEVLPPAKYNEESQRRSRLGSSESDGLRPLFLCRWYFDELKGSFRDVSI